MNFSLIKTEAKKALVGNRFMVFLAIFVVSILTGIISYYGRNNPYITLTGSLILSPLLGGGLFLLIKNLIKNKELDFNLLFACFKDLNHVFKLIGVAVLTSLIVAVGFILLIIPGIIFTFQYSQAIYIMAENPKMSVWDAMKKSKELMVGYKMDLFIFALSFIGHIILIPLTLGIYAIYILPYIQTSFVNYYLQLSGQNIQKNNLSDQLINDYEF